MIQLATLLQIQVDGEHFCVKLCAETAFDSALKGEARSVVTEIRIICQENVIIIGSSVSQHFK